MAYFLLPPNGEESFNTFLCPDPDPDPDHLRGGPSHGYNTSCVKKSSQSERQFLSYASGQRYRQRDPNALPLHSSAGARTMKMLFNKANCDMV